jgi:hypothetical protein
LQHQQHSAIAAVITMPSNNSGRSLPFVYPLDRYDNETNETDETDDEIYNDRLSPRFEVGSEALEVLKKISIPVAPLAIVGRYRTGKSFLLNKLIRGVDGGSQSCFSVGETIEACTRGINLWSEPLIIQKEDGTSYAVLFLDTEGISSTAADTEHDARIFSLAVLLSSLIVYNSVGVIDEDAITNLGFIANLTRHIQAKSEGNVDDEDISGDNDNISLSQVHDRQLPFPSFLWVLRDFALDLRDAESGDVITAREYLEQSLAQQSSFSTDVQARNRVRRSLTQFFKRRDCFTLVRPVDDEEQLAKVDNLPESALRETFRSQLTTLRLHIIDEMVKPKLGISGKGELVTGRILAGLATSYVAAINARAVPSISNAWDGVTKIESMEACASSVLLYESGIAQDAHNGLLPLEENALLSIHTLHAENARSIFKSRAVGPFAEKYLKELDIKITEGLKTLELRNTTASEMACGTLIEKLWHEKIDSHATYYHQTPQQQHDDIDISIMDDLELLRILYFESAKGPAAHKQLSLFLSSKFAIPSLLRTVCIAREADANVRFTEIESRNSLLQSQLYISNTSAETSEKLANDFRRQCEKLKVDAARSMIEATTEKEKATNLEKSVQELTRECESLKSEIKTLRMDYARLKFVRKEEERDKTSEVIDEVKIKEKKDKSINISPVNNKTLNISSSSNVEGAGTRAGILSETALTPISRANFLNATALVPEGKKIAGITEKVEFPDDGKKKGERRGCCLIQ